MEPAHNNPALRFAAASSYLPTTPDGLSRQRALLNQSLESTLTPDLLWEQIRRHRTFAVADQVLSRHHLRSALSANDSALAKSAQHARLEAMLLSAEAKKFSEFLAGHGIVHHCLKGPLLSKKLYGDSGLRHSRDIDVIVHPSQLTAALQALRAAGWTWPNADRWFSSRPYRLIAQSQLWHLEPKHPQCRSLIEVHWRFERFASRSRENIWWTHWKGTGPDVSPAEALHLCMHGASHGWNRMKWLGDLRTLLDRQPAIWLQSWQLAKNLGLLPALAQALLLLEWLYDVTPDAVHRQIVASQPAAASLAKFALTQLAAKVEQPAESVAERLNFLRYGLTMARRQGLRATLAATLSALCVNSDDLLRWNSPSFLLGALPFTRAANVIQRRWPKSLRPVAENTVGASDH